MFDVVIRASRGRQHFLRRAIASVIQQTLSDWKLTIIATVDAEDVRRGCLESFPQSADKIQVRPFEGTFSLGRAINLGIKAGTAPYIAILDDDDTWDPRFLEVMGSYLDGRQGSGYDGVVCQTTVVHEILKNGIIEETSRVLINGELIDVTVPDLLTKNRFTINAFCYPRTCFEAVGGYDEAMEVCEDWEFNLRFLRKFDVIVHAESLANYHQRPRLDADLSNTVHSRPVAHRLARAHIVNEWFRRSIEGTDRYGESVVASHLMERVVEEIQSLARLHAISKDKIGKIDSRTREMEATLKKLEKQVAKASQRSFFSLFRK